MCHIRPRGVIVTCYRHVWAAAQGPYAATKLQEIIMLTIFVLPDHRNERKSPRKSASETPAQNQRPNSTDKKKNPRSDQKS